MGVKTGTNLAPWSPGLQARWGLSWRPGDSLGDLTQQSRKNERVWGSGLPRPLPRPRSARPALRERRLTRVPPPAARARPDLGLSLALGRPPGEAAARTSGAGSQGPARVARAPSQRPPAPPSAPDPERGPPGALPAPTAPRPAARGPHPPAAPPLSPPSSSAPSPPPPPRLPPGRASQPPRPGAQAARPPHLQRARAAEPAPRLPPPDLLLPTRRVSHDARASRPATMTTSLQDGQSAAGRAAARDSPLAAQVCGAAQGRGDARDLVPAPWLHARALLPPPDGTRGCAADR